MEGAVSHLVCARPYLNGFLGQLRPRKSHLTPGSFEEETDEGKRVFQSTRGDLVNTGDEHILFGLSRLSFFPSRM
jgi:hypothetical protein